MYQDPDMSYRFAADHRRELLRAAEHRRLVKFARAATPNRSSGLHRLLAGQPWLAGLLITKSKPPLANKGW